MVTLSGGLSSGSWSPVSDRLLAVDDDGRGYLVDPAEATATAVAAHVLGWEWLATGALVFTTWDGASASLVWLGEGPSRVTALNSPVAVLVPSPDQRQLAFAQDGPDGWLVSIVDAEGAVRSLVAAGGLHVSPPVVRVPEVAISWAPDAAMLAVSPVSAPFAMYLIQAEGKPQPAWYPLTEGYAGEMKWSPDGSRLAISTYSADRKHHRVYVLDSPSETSLRKLMDGCLIFWSPDSRFLVAKPEPYDNDIAAVRVADGAYWRILASKVSMPNLTPAAWGADEDDALRLAQLPARGIGGLGK